MSDTGQYLPLIDQIGVASQRRRAPRVLIDAESLMGRGVGKHAHLHARCPASACALRTVYAGHTLLMHELAPAAVGKDHQLGHDLVEGRTALSAGDGDDVVDHIEIEVNAIILLGTQTETLALFHAPTLKYLRPLPEQSDVFLVGIITAALGQRLLAHMLIQLVVT